MKIRSTFRRDLTTVHTKGPSLPTRIAMEKALINPHVVDWGCGSGRDVKYLNDSGFQTYGWDPYRYFGWRLSEIPFHDVRTVLLNYVLCVVEFEREREWILQTIGCMAHSGTRVLVSVRSQADVTKAADKGNWGWYRDGYVTQRNTFQKGYTVSELVDLCRPFGDVITTFWKGGMVACVYEVIE